MPVLVLRRAFPSSARCHESIGYECIEPFEDADQKRLRFGTLFERSLMLNINQVVFLTFALSEKDPQTHSP